MEATTERQVKTSGPALAAIVSAGVGCAVIGIATVLASASVDIKNLLNWWSPGGPLTGKTGVGVIAWGVSWSALHLMWRTREPANKRVIVVAAVILAAIGLLGTFPPVFEAHR